jgi:hypothetical protein
MHARPGMPVKLAPAGRQLKPHWIPACAGMTESGASLRRNDVVAALREPFQQIARRRHPGVRRGPDNVFPGVLSLKLPAEFFHGLFTAVLLHTSPGAQPSLVAIRAISHRSWNSDTDASSPLFKLRIADSGH